MSIIPVTLSLSLFDSLSTAQQIIIFMLLLTTVNPLRNSMAYLAGLSGAYLACGIGGYLALDELRAFLDKYVPSTAQVPDYLYYQSELVGGMVMTLIGVWYFLRKRHAAADRFQNAIVSRFKSMNGCSAFGIGAFISASSFPLAIPYIIALEKYSALHLGPGAAMGNIMLYNIGYALPMIVVLIIYLYARRKTDDLSVALHEKTRMLNVHLTTWA